MSLRRLALIFFLSVVAAFFHDKFEGQPHSLFQNTCSINMSAQISPAIFNRRLFTSLLDLWFEGLPAKVTSSTQEIRQRWYGAGSKEDRAAFDARCRAIALPALNALSPTSFPLAPFTTFQNDRAASASIAEPLRKAFHTAHEQIEQGGGLGDVNVGLGLLLLLDQMPRNVFRDAEGQKLVYTHYDRLSRAVVHEMMGASPADSEFAGLHLGGSKYRLNPSRRQWFYMPLMHSEDLADHAMFEDASRQLLKDVENAGDAEAAKEVQMSLDFGRMHREILEQFGRYPHRNRFLGREMTREEDEWLEKGGARFGTG